MPGSSPPPPPVWDARPTAPTRTGYGGFWIRLAAYMMDYVLLSLAGFVLGGILGFVVGVAGGGVEFARTGGYVVGFVISWLYFALMESSERGATLGKRVFGLRVVTDRGERLSFGTATGRFFAKLVSAVILCIGFIMVAFTDRNRGLHDMIAGTLVVRTG